MHSLYSKLTTYVYLLVVVFSQHTLANKANHKVAFNIDEQTLSKGLDNFAKQSGAELLFISQVVHNKTNKALTGVYDNSTALTQMLEGTGLTFEKTPDNVYLIKKKPVASQYSYQQYLKARNSNIDLVSDNSGYKVDDLEYNKSFGAEAQQGSNNNDGNDDDEREENVVVVTGSALVTDPAQLTRQVLTVTREEILETGATRLADYLLTLPQNLNAPTTVAAGSLNDAAAFGLAQNEFGDTGINLRGLGEEYTLVLIDGERPSRAGLFSDAFDISTVPLATIERIEIIFDNAVAIYGPDAVGGVLNIITRKDYNGTDISVSVSVTDEPGGERYDASIGNSFSWGSGRLSFDAAIETQKRIDGDARDVDFLSSPGALGEHPRIDGEFVEPGTVERPTLRSTGFPLFFVRDVNGDGDTLDRELNERLPAAFSDVLNREFRGQSNTGARATRLETIRELENYDPVNGLESIGTQADLDRFLADEDRDNLNAQGQRIVTGDLPGRVRDFLGADRRGIFQPNFVPNYVREAGNMNGVDGLGLNYAGYFPVFVVSMPAPEQISDPSTFSIYDIEENTNAPLPSGLDPNSAGDREAIAQVMAERFPVFFDTPYNPQAGVSLAPETTTVSGSIRVSQSISDNLSLQVSYRHSTREQKVEFSNSLRSITLGASNFLDLTSTNRDALPFNSAFLEFSDDGFLPTERPTSVRADNLRIGLTGSFNRHTSFSLRASLDKRDSEAFRRNEINERFFDTANFPRIGSRTIVPLDDNGSPIRFDENGMPLLDENGQLGFRIIYPGIQPDDFVWWLPGFSPEGSLETLINRGITNPDTFSFTDVENRNIGFSISSSLFKLPAGTVRGSFRLNRTTGTSETFTTTVINNLLFQQNLLANPTVVVNERGQATQLRTASGRRTSESFSGELSIPILEDLTFSFATNGTIVDEFDSPGPAFQLGAIWRPADWFSLRWNRSLGDRLPSPTFVDLDVFIREVDNGIQIVENPGFPATRTEDYYVIQGGINDLETERNINDNFGLNIDLEDYGLSFSVNYSLNRTKNLITQRALGRGGVFDPENVTSELFDTYLDPTFQAQTNGIFRSVDDTGGVTVGENVITGFIEGDSPVIAGSLVPGTLVVDQRFTNGGDRRVDNIDFGINKVFEFENAGTLTIRYSHNTVLRDRTIQSDNCSSEVDEFCGEGQEGFTRTPGDPGDFGGFGTSPGGREIFGFPFDRAVNSIATVDQRFSGFAGARLTDPIPEHSGSLGISWRYHGVSTSISTSFRSDTSVVLYDEAPTRTFGIVSVLRAGGRVASASGSDVGSNALLRNTLLTTTKSARDVNLNVNYRFGEGIKFLDSISKSGSISFSVNGLFHKPAKVVSEVIRREFTIQEEDVDILGTEVPTDGNFSVFNFNPRERTYDIRYQTEF